jgi:DNA-binding FadR family transcriptional regulator
LGARRIPDPTTAGDFCRRFTEPDIRALQEAFDETRQKVWSEQPAEFFDEARLDLDGT